MDVRELTNAILCMLSTYVSNIQVDIYETYTLPSENNGASKDSSILRKLLLLSNICGQWHKIC